MKYSLNPCDACFNKYKDQGDNVNDINNCCYEIAAAFKGSTSLNSLQGTDAMKSCTECVAKKLKTMGPFPGGQNFCTKNINPPPIFSQVPHYLPKLLEKAETLDEAVDKCILQCDNTTYPEACKENCLTDSSAVVVDDGNMESSAEQAILDAGNFLDNYLKNTEKQLRQTAALNTPQNLEFRESSSKSVLTFSIFLVGLIFLCIFALKFKSNGKKFCDENGKKYAGILLLISVALFALGIIMLLV